MSASDLALDLLCGTQPRLQLSSEVAASHLKRRAVVSQAVMKRASRLQPYFLTIGASPSFVWYRNAKVCTRSIYATLVASDVKFVAEHAGHVRVPLQLLARRFAFAFVRDPRTRLVSCWQNKVVDHNGFRLDARLLRELQSFDAFVDWVATQNLARCDKHYRLQSRLFDLENVDFVGRFERFGPDFEQVCSQIGIKSRLEHRNPSIKQQVTIGRRAQTLIEDLYRADLEAFSY